MEISLNALVEHIDDHLFELGTWSYRLAAGLGAGVKPVMPQLGRADLFQYVTELIASPRTEDSKRARLELLRRFLARVFVEDAVAGHEKPLAHALEGRTFFAAARTWTPREALREAARQPQREARADVERALATALEDDAPWARRSDTALQAAAALGHSMPSLIELMHGRALQPRLTAAERLLRETDDAWVDLLGFALKRLDPQLTRRNARHADVERAAMAPWLFESLRREDLQHAVTRCVTDLGFALGAEGRLTVDSESRPGRVLGAQMFELRVPGQVRLLLTADAGFEAWAGWLRAWGMALHRVNVAATLPFVERRLGDPAVVDGVGRLFESFLLEQGWLKRYVRLTSTQAREAARLFAFRQLFEIRRAAALALTHTTLCERGAVAPVRDAFVSRMGGALRVEVSPTRTFIELDPLNGHALALDGWALEAALHTHLTERFNEDFFRNPAAGRWLAGLAARGQRDDAFVIAASLGSPVNDAPPSLDVSGVGRRRIALMGA